LPSAPGHAHWQALCPGGQSAGLFSIILHERFSSAQVDTFCDALKVFKLGFSWGGPISLVMPYKVRQMRALPLPDYLQNGHVVRFSIGLEAVEDLTDDLLQAMQLAFD
jgi:cystathionine beta-lyase